ncbi:DUF1493 family protein [Salmonella enterica]|nr:DUF1493 family protein [Salmonella enterica]
MIHAGGLLFALPQVPEFTIGMLIASARSGRWLYD